MRITGGFLRGRNLQPPADMAVRPTSDKARLAVFNMLESRGAVRDAVAIDVFCGTGALGIEAVSRGATQAVFVDVAPTSLNLARKNAQSMGITNQCHFIQGDAGAIGARNNICPPATLVFLDPPYRKNLVVPALIALSRGLWLADDAMVVVETEQGFAPTWPDGYSQDSVKTYGAAHIYLLRFSGSVGASA